ncbi:MAG: dihydropteroate synthase [Phycisphaerales bacterium]
MAHGRSLSLDAPRIIAILNVTPDSFSDGGEIAGPDGALRRAEAALDDGAHMLDVGGESTRPGAARIDAAEQIRRVVPAIEAIRRAGLDCPISVDTTLAPVARAAIDAGADCVNDVSGAREDDAMLALGAERACGIVLMHRLRPPGDDRYSDRYADDAPDYDAGGGVVAVVRAFLRERAQAALEAGVAHDAIVVDPGLGFGKTVAQNLALIRAAPSFLADGLPVLSAASRKSFIGRLSGVEPPAERVAGSMAISVAQLLVGVRLFRVHDVRQHAEALRVAWGLVEAAGIGPG